MSFNKMWDAACQERNNVTTAQAPGVAGTIAPAPTVFLQPLPGKTQIKQDTPASDLWPYYKLWLEYHWWKRNKAEVKIKNSSVLRDHVEISRRKFSKMPCYVFGLQLFALCFAFFVFICNDCDCRGAIYEHFCHFGRESADEIPQA